MGNNIIELVRNSDLSCYVNLQDVSTTVSDLDSGDPGPSNTSSLPRSSPIPSLPRQLTCLSLPGPSNVSRAPSNLPRLSSASSISGSTLTTSSQNTNSLSGQYNISSLPRSSVTLTYLSSCIQVLLV
jgi:hypothetical protein